MLIIVTAIAQSVQIYKWPSHHSHEKQYMHITVKIIVKKMNE